MLDVLQGGAFWEFAKEYGWKGIVFAAVILLIYKVVCKIIDLLPGGAVWVGKMVLLPIRDRIIQHFVHLDAAITEGRESFKKTEENVIGIHTKMDKLNVNQGGLFDKFHIQEEMLGRMVKSMDAECPATDCPFRGKVLDMRKEIRDEQTKREAAVVTCTTSGGVVDEAPNRG